jgi:hypothetical protein
MSEEHRFDPWALPTLVLWLAFFLLGLEPAGFFKLLRNIAGVTTQDALVNSPLLITIGCSVFLAWFAYATCRDAGQAAAPAQARAVQVGVLALLAFHPLSLLEGLAMVLEPGLQTAFDRLLIPFFVAGKLLAWLVLLTLVMGYHLGNRRVFAVLPSVFPSGRTRPPAPGRPDHEQGVEHADPVQD